MIRRISKYIKIEPKKIPYICITFRSIASTFSICIWSSTCKQENRFDSNPPSINWSEQHLKKGRSVAFLAKTPLFRVGKIEVSGRARFSRTCRFTRFHLPPKQFLPVGVSMYLPKINCENNTLLAYIVERVFVSLFSRCWGDGRGPIRGRIYVFNERTQKRYCTVACKVPRG